MPNWPIQNVQCPTSACCHLMLQLTSLNRTHTTLLLMHNVYAKQFRHRFFSHGYEPEPPNSFVGSVPHCMQHCWTWVQARCVALAYFFLIQAKQAALGPYICYCIHLQLGIDNYPFTGKKCTNQLQLHVPSCQATIRYGARTCHLRTHVLRMHAYTFKCWSLCFLLAGCCVLCRQGRAVQCPLQRERCVCGSQTRKHSFEHRRHVFSKQ